mmetsp:Transcript_44101/g.105021  ORF Transcript_44101/g.105021 Transcript_44101/m.105021 type:complete len:817 (+) Transcript_44101:66-2516(+)
MERTGAVLVALACVGTALAGNTGTTFGPQARAMQLTMSGGSTGTALISTFNSPEFAMNATWLTASVQAVCADDPSACSYMSWLIGALAMGIVIIPVITLLSCCGFCCGRSCPKPCNCCCKPCGQPNCCGRYPMHEYAVWEKAGTIALLTSVIAVVLAFSILGFLAVTEVPKDFKDTLAGIDAIADVPADLMTRTKNTVETVKDTALSAFEAANLLFSGVAEVNRKTRVLETELGTLETSIKNLMIIVEGCKSGTTAASCTGEWTETLHGEYSKDRCTTAGFASGYDNRVVYQNTTTGSDYTNNPNGVQCCEFCTGQLTATLESKTALPSSQMFEDINKPFPVAELKQTIDDQVGGYDDLFGGLTDKTVEVKKIITDVRTAVPDEVYIGIAAGLFGPSLIFCFFLLLGMVMAGFQATGKVGSCCLWTGFVIGVLVLIFIVPPFFGIFTMVSQPIGDFCEFLPAPGKPSLEFRVTLDLKPVPPFEDEDFWEKIFDGCLLDGTGNIFPAMALTRETFSAGLGSFNISEMIPAPSLAATTDTEKFTKKFKAELTSGAYTQVKTLYAILGLQCRVGTTETTAAANCPAGADWADYYNDVAKAALSIETQAAVVDTQMTAVTTAAAEMALNFLELARKSTAQISGIIDGVWDIGSCEPLAKDWKGLLDPLCQGVVGDIQAAWGGLFMLLWFVVITLFVTCHGAKVLFQTREGEYKEMDVYLLEEDGIKIVQPSAMSPEAPTFDPIASSAPTAPVVPQYQSQAATYAAPPVGGPYVSGNLVGQTGWPQEQQQKFETPSAPSLYPPMYPQAPAGHQNPGYWGEA